MDFDRSCERQVDDLTCYRYEPLDPALLKSLYVAHHETLGEPTEIFHNNIRERFRKGDTLGLDAMRCFAALAADGRDALGARDRDRLATRSHPNFVPRRTIYRLPACQVDMVETARACGASAKFAGSGGAIVGTYEGESMFDRVRDRLAAIGSRAVQPTVSDPDA